MTYEDPRLSEFRGYFKAKEPGRRERAEAWATAIGLQDVDRLRVSSFLVKTAIRHINGEITQDQARKIIDAHYAGVSRHNEKSRSSGYEYFDPETGEKIESLDVYEAQRRLFEAVGCCDDSGVGKCSVKRVVRKGGQKKYAVAGADRTGVVHPADDRRQYDAVGIAGDVGRRRRDGARLDVEDAGRLHRLRCARRGVRRGVAIVRNDGKAEVIRRHSVISRS